MFVGSKANGPRPLIISLESLSREIEMIRHKRFDLSRPFGVRKDLPIEIRRARKILDDQIGELKLSCKKIAIPYTYRL